MSRFFIVLLALMVYTVLKAAQTWPTHRILAATFVVPFFLIMVGWQFMYRSHPALFNSKWFTAYAWIGSVLVGVWSTYVLFALAGDIAQLVFFIFQKIFPSNPNSDRREFFEKTFRLGIVYASLGLSAAGLVQVLKGPVLKKIKIKNLNLPLALEKLKIVQISDLHVSPTIRKEYVKNVVDQVNELTPDFIFITGDLADGRVSDMRSHLAELKLLKASRGIFYITGNHEYYWNVNDYVNLSKELGFVPLINENKIIDIDGTKLMIAGVTDPAGAGFLPDHKPDFQKAIDSPVKADFKILLAHRPDAVIEAEPFGFDVQFSGHTHNGQYFPFNLLVPLGNKYYRGVNQHGKMQVYVNAGTGYWGPPNRFGISSEITSISLAKS